ncbi:2-amino-4-hydroxy-6-hydroxymethyldihydropteridine diphosphokinase [Gammaproteobacteria bacterium AB-CW1]|uniref:2-amino-4-hydroxy-6-hydroxymethyldihydropteridine pyrophosphokinase n=1 Tax=Natronospira elongata TaxID=3110268 RepID=A0AAP6MLR4_9GAMM|nr:2-amino-4-hydroxy-6-hydroxymethyldihydropteridine diphosphokinase [Gammaproteobacteria bacterium AB-CW1]
MTEQDLAWVGLGANLGDPQDMLHSALSALETLPDCELRRASSLYRTPPMGPPGQPDYVNAVAGLATALSPESLLEALLGLESRLGRRRSGAQRWGPRLIDLDLLCYGQARRESEFLSLPHPGLAERAFVLVPLAEVAPELEVPGVGRVIDRKGMISCEGIERL